MTDTLKQAMELVAEHEGRSLSGAIELSLERYLQGSLRYGETYAAQMFGRLMAAAFSMGGERARALKLQQGNEARLGLALQFARLQGDWIEDPYCYVSACREVIRLLARYRPAGKVDGPDFDTSDQDWRESELKLLLSFFEQEKSKPGRRVERNKLPSEDVLRKRTSIMAALGTFVELQTRQRRNRAAAIRNLQQYLESREKSRAKLAADAAAGRDTSLAEASYEGLDKMVQDEFRNFQREAELDKRLSEAFIAAARNVGIEVDVPQNGSSELELGAVAKTGKAINRAKSAPSSAKAARRSPQGRSAAESIKPIGDNSKPRHKIKGTTKNAEKESTGN
jgi:hypothetical protein